MGFIAYYAMNACWLFLIISLTVKNYNPLNYLNIGNTLVVFFIIMEPARNIIKTQSLARHLAMARYKRRIKRCLYTIKWRATRGGPMNLDIFTPVFSPNINCRDNAIDNIRNKDTFPIKYFGWLDVLLENISVNFNVTIFRKCRVLYCFEVI